MSTAAGRAQSELLRTLQSAVAATGNGGLLDVDGVSAVLVQIAGTFSATVTFEATLDGTNFVAVAGTNLNDRSTSTTATAAGLWLVPVAGADQFRARVTWTSGTSVTVVARALPPGVAEAVGAREQGDATNGTDVDVTREPVYTAPVSGELQGSASALQLPNVACRIVRFKALASNAGKVYLGAAGVTKADGTTDTTSGLEIGPGDDTGWIPVDNLNRLYRICDNAGDDLTYLALA